MDGGEQRRMIKCAGGSQDKTIINQIMLRFRPIAPKPVDGSGGLDSTNNKNLLVSKRRNKRKYVRVRKNNRLKRNQCKNMSLPPSSSPSDRDKGYKENDNKIVTLQLLPEQSGQLKEWCNRESNDENNNINANQNNNQDLKLKQPVVDIADRIPAEMTLKKKVRVESCVTVEFVAAAAASMDGRDKGIGCTDMERMKNLEEDTRPGFISDGSDAVRWVNGAYKSMMMKELGRIINGDEMEVMVCLVTKEKLAPYGYCCSSAFTCWVRLQYYMVTLLEKQIKCSAKMVPCDVWRMDCGGFAWRLDVEAALALGR